MCACKYDVFGARFRKTDTTFKTKKLRSFVEHRTLRHSKLMQIQRQQSRYKARQNKFENFEMHYIIGLDACIKL